MKALLALVVVCIALSGCAVTKQSLVVTTTVDNVDVSYVVEGDFRHASTPRQKERPAN